MNALYIASLPNLVGCFPGRFRTFNCLSAFSYVLFYIFVTCVLCMKSILRPSNFTESPQEIFIPSKSIPMLLFYFVLRFIANKNSWKFTIV